MDEGPNTDSAGSQESGSIISLLLVKDRAFLISALADAPDWIGILFRETGFVGEELESARISSLAAFTLGDPITIKNEANRFAEVAERVADQLPDERGRIAMALAKASIYLATGDPDECWNELETAESLAYHARLSELHENIQSLMERLYYEHPD